MRDILERLNDQHLAWAPLRKEATDEIERLRERLGPLGLEIVMVDGAGHYVNTKVKSKIEQLHAHNAELLAALHGMMGATEIIHKLVRKESFGDMTTADLVRALNGAIDKACAAIAKAEGKS